MVDEVVNLLKGDSLTIAAVVFVCTACPAPKADVLLDSVAVAVAVVVVLILVVSLANVPV